MLRLLADENLNRTIVTGVFTRLDGADFLRAQDVGLTGSLDPDVLEWAARNHRIVVSHDVSTMRGFPESRIRDGHGMPGLLLVPSTTTAAVAIAELILLCECSDQSDWQNVIAFLPL